jgi:hypothetical protein
MPVALGLPERSPPKPGEVVRASSAPRPRRARVSLGSTDPLIARVMTTVGKGLHHDRAELDEWFQIGTRLDPAISRGIAKLERTGPNGSGVMTPRSRTAVASPDGVGHPRADDLSRRAQRCRWSAARGARFWRQGSVCDDVQSRTKSFASIRRQRRSQPLRMRLADCGRWKDADRQFKLLGRIVRASACSAGRRSTTLSGGWPRAGEQSF